MRKFQRTAFIVGTVVTAVVLLADLLGLFRWFEDGTVDMRLRDARWVDEPPSDALRLVGIDDASLDTIGRWPWPRERLARAVAEVADAGAKVSVFDVLFLEPEDDPLRAGAGPSSARDVEETSAGDRALADAMRRGGMQSVLALNVLEEKQLDAAWRTPSGRAALQRFADAVEGGITRDIQELADQARLEPQFRSRVLDRPLGFKGLASWMVLQEAQRAGRLPADFAAYERMMLGGSMDAAHSGQFQERILLQLAWQRVQSWSAIEGSLRPDVSVHGSPQDAPPIPVLARAGSAFGVVNAEPDRIDGRLRRVTPFFPTDYGWAPQLGLAAAAKYLGLKPSEIEWSADSIALAGRAMQLRRGKLPLDWPTRLLNGYGPWQGEPLAVLRIGRLIELSDMRERLAELRARHRKVAHELVFVGDVLSLHRGDFDAFYADRGRLRAELVDCWVEQGYGERFMSMQGHRWVDGPLDRTPVIEQWVRMRLAIDELRGNHVKHLSPAEVLGKHGALAREAQIAGILAEILRLERDIGEASAEIAANERTFRELLGGKLVFFGFIATGTMADMVGTIFDPRTPGVFGHIAVADMVLGGRSLRFSPWWVSPLAIVTLGLTAAVVAARFGAGAGFAALALLLAGYAGMLGVVVFDRLDLVFPMAAPVSAGLGSWVFATAGAAIVDRREKQRITKQFRARVSSQLVDLLSENPKALSMEGVERETTILFGDLAGFTTISEKLGGPEVVKTLNLYMGAMTRELTLEHAYVNKFLGDGLLAFWSAFAPEPRQCEYAVKAALNCQKLVKEIGERPDRAGLPPITLRLGIATGKVVIGDCGAPPDLNDYTVIGDAVNLASRLESANKQFGTRILVDGRTAESAAQAGLPLCRLGRVVVVGQSVPVDVAEVCLDEDPSVRIRMTEAAVQAFARADFDAARRMFGELETRFGASKTAHAFVEAMDNPSDLRDGVLRLRAK